MNAYSDKLVELMDNPEYKEAIDELLESHTKFVNGCRDFREQKAKEQGMTYTEYMEYLAKQPLPSFERGTLS